MEAAHEIVIRPLCRHAGSGYDIGVRIDASVEISRHWLWWRIPPLGVRKRTDRRQ